MTLEKISRWLQRLATRTGRGPLRPLWAAAHRVVIWSVAVWVTAGLKRYRTYLKGGFGFGEPVYGLSDVDMILVVEEDPTLPAARREQVQRRWQSLLRRLPTIGELFHDGELWVYEQNDLSKLRSEAYLTFGLRAAAGGDGYAPGFLGERAPHDPMALLDHPGLYGPQRDWRRLGSSRRPPAPIADPSARAIFAWLELRFVWGYAFLLSADSTPLSAAYTCQKLVADSARIWLWLRFGEQTFGRDQTLARALRRLPEEEEALRGAIELGRTLPRRPEPPLAEALPFLVRTSSRIAEQLAAAAAATSSTDVNLVWDRADQLLVGDDAVARASALGAARGRKALLPLADWRARAIPGPLDAALAVLPGDPSDAVCLGALARAEGDGFFPGLRAGGLLVLPTAGIWHRGRLRGVECQVTDPVSTALADGDLRASFADLPGWSAQDCARRALAEHRAWLEPAARVGATGLPYWAQGSSSPELVELSGLFTAARAALFADSLHALAPELPLTAATIARRLAEYAPEARTAAETGYESLSACRLRQHPLDQRVVLALRRTVRALPAYSPRPSPARIG
jgi:hypothetical protein